ncbi:hypothetical protein LguiB_023954 [Lonicera macranthoides]
MSPADRLDDLTFRLNFAGDGAAKLRERVREKLKEFMGDYTDDTLVEYVVVLLKNGRRKEEAKNELNVFLGDDSDSFVSWLWDHLGSNLDLYVESAESCPREAANKKPTCEEQAGRNGYHKLDSEPEREKNMLSKNRHNREWKGLVRGADGPPLLRSIVTTNVNVEGTHRKVGHARQSPPRPVIQRKRSRPDDLTEIKREAVPKATVDASRRLLQFAVRDAVAPSNPSILTMQTSSKRLRSVVSTSNGDSSLDGRTERIHSVSRAPNHSAVTVKAVDEAAKNVIKVRSSRNVFDRLGRAIDVEESREVSIEGGQECGNYIQRRDYNEQYVGEIASDFENEGYGVVNALGCRVLDVSQAGPSGGNRVDDLMMVQSTVANNTEVIERKAWKDKHQLVNVANASSSKIQNTSVNVNTWKQPHYRDPKEISDMDSRKFAQESEAGAGKSGGPPPTENGNSAIPAADDLREHEKAVSSTPGLYSTGRPIEDADSRTIFVSNVHFAATKDSLSRHFNKFGDVLKVIIVTDAATGQPKGSAYVEFTKKEAAEHALSLDGTSFMSRILKVVRKTSAPQEAVPAMPWPHIARGSSFVAPRFSRAPFPRGIPSIYRSRLPVKVGGRSMQWKRETAQTTSSDGGAPSVSSNSVPSPTARSLTYVRTESRINENSGNV